jgi:hypothetical protein
MYIVTSLLLSTNIYLLKSFCTLSTYALISLFYSLYLPIDIRLEYSTYHLFNAEVSTQL